MIKFVKAILYKIFRIKQEKIFVYCFDNDTRSKKEKWNDIEYVKSVTFLKENQIWISEMLIALRDARLEEEKATTFEEWAKKHEVVKKLMELIRLPDEAKLQLQVLRNLVEIKKNENN